ncbi:MAG: YidC/Oxa1 family membrane protein insertase [Lachnospiraceae bacterium]|nr:YidC/Oxa1 family membrane protein insertase [Lachnospiraceae bacterium]
MSGILLTQNSTFIIGPISKLLGYLMEGIFFVLDKIGLPNIGLSIIIFTIVIYMLMLPLTIKQQKFSKLSARMQPELQVIQNKYKNKKDNDSMMAMQQETQAVYAKYGVSPTGSCLQLIIQMPILFALYRVIYAIPAYVGKVKDAFFPLVDNLIAQNGSSEFIQSFQSAGMYSKQFTNESFTSGVTSYVQNTYIDVLNRASTAEWTSIVDKFPSLQGDVDNTLSLLNHYNNFLGLNIADSPSFIIKEAISSHSYFVVVGAILIPVLAALTQWIGVKLMPQPEQANKDANDQASSMQSSMKMMNNIMPIMSAVFCYTLPCGMGIYWIAGAVVRGVQQVMVNKHIDKMDFDEVIKKNVEKRNAKLKKAGIDPEKMNSYATMNTKKVSSSIAEKAGKSTMTAEERDEAVKKATEYYNSKNAAPGSLAAKANMVKEYNEKNNK